MAAGAIEVGGRVVTPAGLIVWAVVTFTVLCLVLTLLRARTAALPARAPVRRVPPKVGLAVWAASVALLAVAFVDWGVGLLGQYDCRRVERSTVPGAASCGGGGLWVDPDRVRAEREELERALD